MRAFWADVWTGWRTGPARTALAFFSLALGLYAVAILLSTLDALQRQAEDLVRQFGAGAFVLIRPEDPEQAPSWSRDEVRNLRLALGPTARVSGLKTLPPDAADGLTVVAADEELARARDWAFVAGRGLDARDIRDGSRHAVASQDLCARHGWVSGQIILLGREPFRLIGCFAGGELPLPALTDQAVFVPHTADVLEADGEEDLRRVDAIVFRADAQTSPEHLRRRVAALLSQPEAPLSGAEWITPESLLAGIRRWQQAIAWTAGSGGVLSLLLGAAMLAGMLLTGVRERIPEIGLRRALGARRREVAGLFVTEAILLTLAAALAGMAGAEITLRGLGERFPLPFHFSWAVRLWPLALAMVIALACSLAPAWLAARLPPAEALRNE